jgi:hypothetical protein
MPRTALVLLLMALSSPNLAAQVAKSPSAPPLPPSDPQAVTFVQAAIAALGGASAISQTQSWAIQGTLAGPFNSRAWSETIVPKTAASATVPPSQPTRPTTSAPNILTTSFFVPALLGAVLSEESQDPNYTLRYVGPTILGSEAVTEIVFSRARTAAGRAQVWYFDSKTSLPAQIEFNLPAQLGHMKSPIGTVAVSNYQPIAGILYPTHIVVTGPGSLPEVITTQSVSPNAINASIPVAVGGAK